MFFREIIFSYLEDTRRSKSCPLEQHALIIIGTFKGQDNDTLRKLCAENNCDFVIVPHNLSNKFQPLDLSVSKAAKSFIQNKYNDCLLIRYLRSFKTEKILPMLKYHPDYRV